jgi:putative transposase
MQNDKSGSHTVWDCKYRLVWITKYRVPVLTGDVGERCRELLREIARSQEMTIYAGALNRDHVHMLIGIPPNLSVSRAVQFLKGKSSHKLLSAFAGLRKRCWGQHLWGRGYWVVSSGNVTDEMWQTHIQDQKPEVPATISRLCGVSARRADLIRLQAVT